MGMSLKEMLAASKKKASEASALALAETKSSNQTNQIIKPKVTLGSLINDIQKTAKAIQAENAPKTFEIEKQTPEAAVTLSEINNPEQVETLSSEGAEQLKSAFDILKNSMENSEQVGQALNYVLQTLQQFEEVRKNLAPQDFGLMIHGLRQEYGSVIVNKTNRKTKKTMKEERVSEFENLMKEGLQGISLTF